MLVRAGRQALLLAVTIGCGGADNAAMSAGIGVDGGATTYGGRDSSPRDSTQADGQTAPEAGAPPETSNQPNGTVSQGDGSAVINGSTPSDGSLPADSGGLGGGDGSAPAGRWLGADTGMSTIPALKTQTGAQFRVHLGFSNWTQSWGNQFTFTAQHITSDTAAGAATMMTWGPNDTIPNVLTGMYDAYLHQWAKDAKADGRRFLLRMAHEANGGWYIWNYAGSVPATKFADMWKHVHDIFTAEGATNVKWVFCPNSVGTGIVDFTNAYPGDAYVDYVGLDSYNFFTNGSWHTFSDIFLPSYKLMQALTNKPLILCETASAEDPNNTNRKAQWITDAFETTIPNLMPNVIGVIWFNEKGPPNWQVDTTPASLAAFQAVSADPKWQATLPGFP